MAVVTEIDDEDTRQSTTPHDASPKEESGFLGSLANSIFEVSLRKYREESLRTEILIGCLPARSEQVVIPRYISRPFPFIR